MEHPGGSPTRPLPPTPDHPGKQRGPTKRQKQIMLFIMVLTILAGTGLVVWKVVLPRFNHEAAPARPVPTVRHLPRGTVSTIPPSHRPSAAATRSAVPLPPNLRRLQADINSSDRATQALALLPEERASFMQGPPLLPAGYKLTIDPSTLKLVNGNVHIATVVAMERHGQNSRRYQLGLYRKDASSPWLLAISKELP